MMRLYLHGTTCTHWCILGHCIKTVTGIAVEDSMKSGSRQVTI